MDEFYRIKRLPPYVFAIVNDLKTKARARGIPRLRVAIAKWYRDRYGVELDPDSETIATIGAKEGLAHLALAVLQPGDGALVPNPTYPIHSYSVVIADGDLRSVPLT